MADQRYAAVTLFAALLFMLLGVPAARADFYPCKSDLEDAAQAASDADDAEDEYESCDHDEPGDCREKHEELASAKDEVVGKLRWATLSCKLAAQ
jgi:hypothetical protein